MLIKREEFCLWVESHKTMSKQSYIDTVLDACEKFSVQESFIKDLLNPQIISKLEAEAKELNFIKNSEFSIKDFL